MIKLFLQQVFPPIYRFGSGAIVDAIGNSTGQLDIVMELPFAPSFPLPGGAERLYLAESVAAVFEVKSQLSSQWKEVETTVSKVRKLKRKLRLIDPIEFESSPQPIPKINVTENIPLYAIGIKGYSDTQKISSRLSKTKKCDRPDGIFVFDSGAFVGVTEKSGEG